jgi:GH15 family glucan-1,4-alpha-glucosidase
MQQQIFNSTYQPIENYAVIGNLHTVALVSLFGSIDFMCFPRFDSPSVFCKLLDAGKGGSFSIMPSMDGILCKQLYLHDTNILITRFLAGEGIAEIIDYMPVGPDAAKPAIVRRVTSIRGNIRYKMLCSPRFNYANGKHSIKKSGRAFLFTPEDDQLESLCLFSSTSLTAKAADVSSEFILREGEKAGFILCSGQDNIPAIGETDIYIRETYRETIRFWQSWIARSNYKGRWQESVNRSALTLKLLISHPYGSMVAAPTFSLPESVGNGRNWDYRFTWIRDAAFSMHAFLQLGFMEEAEAFLNWVKKQSTEKALQLMFTIDGSSRLDEKTLDHLEGYKNSRPVRIGNQASKQTQMDIYGELLETVYIYAMHGGDLTYEYWKIISGYVELVINNWQKPDHSIWEVRGIKREFLFSRMMCWIALDRAIKIATLFSFPYDILKWHKARDEIFIDVQDNFWNEEKQAYVQYKGGSSLDASALLMPILNLISPNSDRWKKTMDAINRELKSDVLIYRYKEEDGKNDIDGLKGKEGTFTMCSFWHVECLALEGKMEEAAEQFEKMLGYANHLGLFAEQIGMKGEQLGNFPQAFTHLALISAAIALNNKSAANAAGMPSFNKNMK